MSVLHGGWVLDVNISWWMGVRCQYFIVNGCWVSDLHGGWVLGVSTSWRVSVMCQYFM